MKNRIASLALLALAMVACAPPGFHDPFLSDSHKYKESYDFTENGCPTNQHQFEADSPADVKSQLCSALQNDSLNNHCAYYSRRQMFIEKCDGSFNPR